MGVVTSEGPSQAALPPEVSRYDDFEDVGEQSSPLDEMLLDAKRRHAFFPEANSTTANVQEQDPVDSGARLTLGAVLLRIRRVRAFEGAEKATELAAQLAQQLRAAADGGAEGSARSVPPPEPQEAPAPLQSQCVAEGAERRALPVRGGA
uniref:Uncharacterized protein n=1 Tax=Alexandrium catenella TaxID=2925 RepID=A0A7S1RWY2_ALECA